MHPACPPGIRFVGPLRHALSDVAGAGVGAGNRRQGRAAALLGPFLGGSAGVFFSVGSLLGVDLKGNQKEHP